MRAVWFFPMGPVRAVYGPCTGPEKTWGFWPGATFQAFETTIRPQLGPQMTKIHHKE